MKKSLSKLMRLLNLTKVFAQTFMVSMFAFVVVWGIITLFHKLPH